MVEIVDFSKVLCGYGCSILSDTRHRTLKESVPWKLYLLTPTGT